MQRQKLRSSCDSCHGAKVRCASGGPLQTCERCASHGIQCSYSPSLRLAKENNAKQASISSTPDQSRRRSITTLTGPLPNQIHTGRNRTKSRASYGNISPPALIEDFSIDGIATPSTSSSNFPITTQAQDFVTPLWTSQSPSDPNMIAHMAPIDESMFWNGDAVDRIFGKSGLGPSSNKKQILAPNAGEVTINATDIDLPNDVLSAKWSAQSNDGFVESRNACRCHAEVLQALHLSQHLGSGVRKSGDLHIAFDVLLAENKSALRQCTQMLDCKPCFGGNTSFLLVTTLLSQTLTLYHLACKIYLTRSTVEKDGWGSGPIVPGLVRINFGAYKLEEEDEILLKKELMLIELRKVEALMSRLKVVADGFDDQAESAMHDALLSSLTRSLKKAVLMIQPGR